MWHSRLETMPTTWQRIHVNNQRLLKSFNDSVEKTQEVFTIMTFIFKKITWMSWLKGCKSRTLHQVRYSIQNKITFAVPRFDSSCCWQCTTVVCRASLIHQIQVGRLDDRPQEKEAVGLTTWNTSWLILSWSSFNRHVRNKSGRWKKERLFWDTDVVVRLFPVHCHTLQGGICWEYDSMISMLIMGFSRDISEA